MKNLLCVGILLVGLAHCRPATDQVETLPPVVSLLGVYPVKNTEAEANVVISGQTRQISEVGVVWSDKPNPNINDNRQAQGDLQGQTTFFLQLSPLQTGQNVYVRAYYVQKGSVVYSQEEVELTQNFTGNWSRLASPLLATGQYIPVDSYTPAMVNGALYVLVLYIVNRYTNFARPAYYFPTPNGWQDKIYDSESRLGRPMRFGSFRAEFIAYGTEDAALIGGGYQKPPGGDPFYLKNMRIAGFLGDNWPLYPGANVPTSSFGLSGAGYVLENKPDGKLWRFNMDNFQWEIAAKTPVQKEGKWVSFDAGERTFILLEPANWTDGLDGLYEFMPATDSWQKRRNFPGENRRRALAFTAGNKLYYGAGQSAQTFKPLRDIWVYDPATDLWQKETDYPGTGNANLVGIGVMKTAYIGFGQQIVPGANRGEIINYANDFWQYKPR